MPYISIKAFPKDKEIKEKVVDEINEVFAKYWGCPREAISISLEEVEPANWEENVVKKDIEISKDKMFILNGKKSY